MISDMFFVEVTAYIQQTSTTSFLIGTGSKTFTLASAIKFPVGMTVLIDGGGGNTMTGVVTSDNGRTTSVTINVTSVAGSGTISSWVIGGEKVFYFADNGGFDGKPTDTPANVFFSPYLDNPGEFSQYIFQNGTTFGMSQVGYGNTSLNNSDENLDYLLDYGYDGRSIVKRRGQPDSAYPGGMTTIFTGTMAGIVDSGNYLYLLTRDKQGLVSSLPIQTTKFAGTNNLVDTGVPNVEGVPGDLQGKPKPIWLGANRGVSPPLVNTSKQTYQLSTLPMISTGFVVYDKGIVQTLHTTETTLMGLQNATVPASKYSVYFGNDGEGTFIRTGTALNEGVITIEGHWDVDANQTAAYIADYILTNYGGISGGFTGASVSALDTKNSSVVGFWTDTTEYTIGEVIDYILQSVGGYWAITNDGDFTLGRLETPAVSADHTLNDYQLLGGKDKITRSSSNDKGGGLPAKRCLLDWGKNYTILNATDVAGSALTVFEFYTREYRTVYSAINTSTLTKHPLAQEIEFTTQFHTAANAQTEVDRLGVLYKNEYFNVDISVQAVYSKNMQLGQTIALEDVRTFYARNYLLTGISNDYKTDFAKLQLLAIG